MRYAWVERIVARCCPPAPPRTAFTERLDRVLLHRVWGLGIFAVIMAALLGAAYVLIKPGREEQAPASLARGVTMH